MRGQQRPQRNGGSSNFWYRFQHQLREWRHNPCLMTPTCAFLLLILGVLGLAVILLKFPTMLLAMLLQPAANRFAWVIEFIYPTALGRSVHFFLLKLSGGKRKSRPNDKCYGYHSRTIESRYEIVKGRVYVHPLPQLMDNLGYLVVCCPSPPPAPTTAAATADGTPAAQRRDGPWLRAKHKNKHDKITVTNQPGTEPIVAFVVDCGDAQAVARQIKLISKVHYHKQPIQVQSILATHKHHDHTAGIRGLLNHPDYHDSIKLVMGGVVERVPLCNFDLANGDLLPLPRHGENDMKDVIEVEAVATPAHTRGSLAFCLRPISGSSSDVAALLFTGDTMFSAGGGVPFEADVDTGGDQQERLGKVLANSYIHASAAKNAMERCFSEILHRSVATQGMLQSSSDGILVCPGHEYTQDLLNRQLVQPMDHCKWKNFAPNVFFEVVSHFYVALHRRSLPFSSGKLLLVPTPISRELAINPNLRSLKKRGEIVLSAIRFWNHHFAARHIADDVTGPYGLSGVVSSNSSVVVPTKSPSTDRRWNLNARDVSAPVFTTVYADDLNQVIDDLDAGKIDAKTAACQLREIKDMLHLPVVGRRPIPGSLPSERVVYKGLVGFVLLGSAPCGLTLSDSEAMKIPPPIVGSSSDLIRVSKSKLVSVLYWLGLLTEENEGKRIVAIIDQIWKEAQEYESKLNAFPVQQSAQQNGNGENGYGTTTDVESSAGDDTVDLGSLKWIVYGVPSQKPSCWPSFCVPCAKPQPSAEVVALQQDHPIHKSDMKRESGELVRHDVLDCLICKGAAGNPDGTVDDEQEDDDDDEDVARVGSSSFLTSAEDEGEDGIEIDRSAIGSMMP